MARTRSKERAATITSVSQELAPDLNPVIVYSGPGRTIPNRERLPAPIAKTSGYRMLFAWICLGEGFDLPDLKVAALHDIHKSLAVTLQFIGRFTRKGDPTKSARPR